MHLLRNACHVHWSMGMVLGTHSASRACCLTCILNGVHGVHHTKLQLPSIVPCALHQHSTRRGKPSCTCCARQCRARMPGGKNEEDLLEDGQTTLEGFVFGLAYTVAKASHAAHAIPGLAPHLTCMRAEGGC